MPCPQPTTAHDADSAPDIRATSHPARSVRDRALQIADACHPQDPRRRAVLAGAAQGWSADQPRGRSTGADRTRFPRPAPGSRLSATRHSSGSPIRDNADESRHTAPVAAPGANSRRRHPNQGSAALTVRRTRRPRECSAQETAGKPFQGRSFKAWRRVTWFPLTVRRVTASASDGGGARMHPGHQAEVEVWGQGPEASCRSLAEDGQRPSFL